ncbi:retrotransposon protein, putative, ty1-copia subclass [Tanacetum coccineum]
MYLYRIPKGNNEVLLLQPTQEQGFCCSHAEFFENSLTLQEACGSHELLEASGSDVGLELIKEDDTQPSNDTSKQHDEVEPNEVEPHSVNVPIRRSKMISQAPDRYGFYVDVEEHELRDLDEPSNYKVAMSDPKFDKWLDVINAEMQSMKDNQVWCLVDLPPNARTIATKGYTQTYGVDYGETFSPAADIRVIRILLAIAVFYDYEIWQMDVKQASRSWNKRFDEEIKKVGFTQNPNEPCVYLKASRSNVAFLVAYVNDIIIMGNNITMLQDIKSWLCKCFSMKDLGEVAYILEIKIKHDRSKRLIDLSQSTYFDKILKKFKMENSKRGSVPMQEKPNLSKAQSASIPSEVNRMQRVPYA